MEDNLILITNSIHEYNFFIICQSYTAMGYKGVSLIYIFAAADLF